MSDVKLNSGVFVFSWDFELAWGFHDRPNLPARLRKYDSREFIGQIIDILEEYSIPSTWATVGHLLLSECSKTDGRPHANISAPSDGWYDSDPCSDVQVAPLRYAPDVVRRLRSCKAMQEIGSHTFSHVTMDIDSDVVRAELTECKRIAKEGEMVSFVSPRHGEVPSSVLAELDYVGYREPSQQPPMRRAAKFYAGVGSPRTGIPTLGPNGVWRHPVSTYFFYNPLNVVQRRVPYLKRRWFESGLQRAASAHEVFHVWAHPHNFIGDDQALDQFHWLIKRVAKLEAEGHIEAMTMNQLTTRLESD